jgi:hypothetical protein
MATAPAVVGATRPRPYATVGLRLRPGYPMALRRSLMSASLFTVQNAVGALLSTTHFPLPPKKTRGIPCETKCYDPFDGTAVKNCRKTRDSALPVCRLFPSINDI